MCGRIVVTTWPHGYSLNRSGHVQGQGTTHATIKFLADAAHLESTAIELDIVAPGDVVFFDCKLFHRSGMNQSNRSRIVFNPRYSDALASPMVARGWISMRDKIQDLLEGLHPQLLA